MDEICFFVGVCGVVGGASSPLLSPRWICPYFFIKILKKDMLEENREMPTKPQSLVDDLATTD